MNVEMLFGELQQVMELIDLISDKIGGCPYYISVNYYGSK